MYTMAAPTGVKFNKICFWLKFFQFFKNFQKNHTELYTVESKFETSNSKT